MSTDLQAELERVYHELEAVRKRMAELRRQMPAEDVNDYALQRSDGSAVQLSDLFGEHDDLILVHNMGRGCSYCTLWADGFNGVAHHLANRAAFVVASPDGPELQRDFAASRDWRFPMVSTAGSTFTSDMGYYVEGQGYWPGVSVFRRAPDGSLQRVSRDFFGPGDTYCGVWHLFDLLPQGANGWEPALAYGPPPGARS